MTLVPAYGRDYRSKAEVQAAWDAGKDFLIASVGPWMGHYVSKGDLAVPAGSPKEVSEVSIRYRKLTQVVIIPV